MDCLVDEALQKTLREIKIQSTLSEMEGGRFVAKILDAIASDNLEDGKGYLYLVMEYLPTDLFKLLELSQFVKFDEATVKKILY